jgi:hypothetical protein
MKRKGCSKQQCLKRVAGECLFCGEKDYSVLDPHRIFEGRNGGTYVEENVVVCCATCHRKIHAGKIKVLGKHRSYGTWKMWLVHWVDEDGEEKWK